ncbi:DUF255 domain-containing protein [bacterium]|nr:DUF255 domain-containing protein [bacterium]
MKKNIHTILFMSILAASLGLLSFSYTATKSTTLEKSDKGIEFFHGTWKEALAEAQSSGKPIFADVYAVWCGPCKMMSNYVFTQGDVGEFFNKNFVCVKVDAERGEGPAVARKYAVEGYPTLLFVNGEGETLIKTAGARSGNDLIKLGEKVLEKAK